MILLQCFLGFLLLLLVWVSVFLFRLTLKEHRSVESFLELSVNKAPSIAQDIEAEIEAYETKKEEIRRAVMGDSKSSDESWMRDLPGPIKGKIKSLLIKRAMSTIQRSRQLVKEQPNKRRLNAEKLISDEDFEEWESQQETILDELEIIKEEATLIEPGWDATILSEAVSLLQHLLKNAQEKEAQQFQQMRQKMQASAAAKSPVNTKPVTPTKAVSAEKPAQAAVAASSEKPADSSEKPVASAQNPNVTKEATADPKDVEVKASPELTDTSSEKVKPLKWEDFGTYKEAILTEDAFMIRSPPGKSERILDQGRKVIAQVKDRKIDLRKGAYICPVTAINNPCGPFKMLLKEIPEANTMFTEWKKRNPAADNDVHILNLSNLYLILVEATCEKAKDLPNIRNKIQKVYAALSHMPENLPRVSIPFGTSATSCKTWTVEAQEQVKKWHLEFFRKSCSTSTTLCFLPLQPQELMDSIAEARTAELVENQHPLSGQQTSED